jgi:hypothetical protein
MAVKSKKAVAAAADIDIESAAVPGTMALFSPMSLDSFADFSRDTFAAVTKSNLALSEGLQAIGHEILAYATSSLESASQTATALLGAKTLDEVIQLNSDLARSALGTLVERSAKLSEMGVALASETFAPLGGRVEATLHKLRAATA